MNPAVSRLRPLDGITVVGLEQAVAGPFATRQLADLGARVIKIERPGVGDFARHYDESVKGSSSYFVWLNRSKESLTLDLKSPPAREIVGRLLEGADVLVQNLAPGAAERIGVGVATLRRRYPRLIPCTISGYGSHGPWATRKAYDLLVQSEAGLLSVTGTPAAPAKAGISVADIAAGMYAYSGILTALYLRAATGEVCPVETSLFAALGEWMGAPAHLTDATGHEPARAGAQHATIAPYGPFTSRDGRTIVVAIQNEREWASFCTTFLGDPAWATDERFARNSARIAHRAALNERVARRFAELDAPAATNLLDQAGIAHARLNTIAEFLCHPVLADEDRWRQIPTPGGSVRALTPPVRLGNFPAQMGPVPALGQHTDAILSELGFDQHQIAQFRTAGTI
jgi:crotonobetainyl-CoA:carnitine CoA-transferase CaiB-like acyl-CoA transferase